ncbi:hypothetical protein BH20ACI1_BH20ACI1_30860 [soil metagenome]
MITGFNTDIDYQGITYHVQTEDKGVDTPLILSLVYDRGTILASKRSPYDDLLATAFDEKMLVERLQKQHKLMCAAVRAGRIEDLKRMTMKESASRQKGLIAQKEVKPVNQIIAPKIQTPIEIKTEKPQVAPPILFKEPIPSADKKIESVKFDLPPTKPKVESNPLETLEEIVWDIPIDIVEDTIIEAVQIIEEEMILPAEAVEILTDLGKTEEIVDFTLKVELLNEVVFKSGERKTISILVFRGSQQTGLGNVQVIVKVIGTSFRPLIFHAKTDSNGIAVVHLQLPNFQSGRAAVLIKAMSEGEETELRRVIKQG